MKAWIGVVCIIGAIVGLVTHNNPWASLGMAVLGGVLIDPVEVTNALRVVAPKIGQRISGIFTTPPDEPDGGKHP